MNLLLVEGVQGGIPGMPGVPATPGATVPGVIDGPDLGPGGGLLLRLALLLVLLGLGLGNLRKKIAKLKKTSY